MQPLVRLLLLSLTLCSCTPLTPQQKIIRAARGQIGKTTSYNPSYMQLRYPKGDVPLQQGVCSDVIIRALRKSHKIDLQKEIHEDMCAHFADYPSHWGLRTPDANIDHRRVPNIQTYFRRQGWELPLSKIKENYQPGDIITCSIGGKAPHIMIVSDRKGVSGHWAVLQNGWCGTTENDVLFNEHFTGPLTGHYRIP